MLSGQGNLDLVLFLALVTRMRKSPAWFEVAKTCQRFWLYQLRGYTSVSEHNQTRT